VQVSAAGARRVAITMDAAKVVWSTTGTAVAVHVRDSAAAKPGKTFSLPGTAATLTPAWFGASGLRIGFAVSRYVRDGSAPRDRLAWMNGDGTGGTLTYDAPPGSIDMRKLSWGSDGMLFAMRPPGSSVRNLYTYRPGTTPWSGSPTRRRQVTRATARRSGRGAARGSQRWSTAGSC